MRPILCGALLLVGSAAHAADEFAARLEAGVGGLAMVLPDYRGSDRYGTRVLPIPYVAYRSEHVQLTREGLRARLWSLDRVTASISGAASLPGSDDNPERAGMPQIDPTAELGPSLDVSLHERDDALKVKLRLPVRAVVAADGLDLRDAGWTFVPHLRLDLARNAGDLEWYHLGSVGLVWASEDYHEYFYGVAPEHATAQRPAYDATGGYSGVRLSFSSTVRYQRWRFGAFASYDHLGGAAYEDSPLVRTDHAATAGLFATYRFHASGTGAPLEGED